MSKNRNRFNPEAESDTPAPEVSTEETHVSESKTETVSVDPETGETAAPVMEDIKLLKKIVAKDICGRKALVYKKDDNGAVIAPEERPLYTLFGTANATKTGESDYGTWIAFIGTFEAVRKSDGMRYKSDTCFLQDPAEGMLLNALTSALKVDKGASVGFAFEVGVKPSQRWVDTDAGNSYEYTVTSRMTTERHDPLALMRQQLAPVLKLSGPQPEKQS
jgi:hypothetical protein